MRMLVVVLFVLVGLINFGPIVGVLGAGPLAELYGITVSDPDLLLLLRHRAMLFGLIGTLLLVAAFRRGLRNLAATLGMVSMVSFCVLALPLDSLSPALQRVFWIDVVAIALLAVGWWIGAREQTP